jgi:hypothetical protein
VFRPFYHAGNLLSGIADTRKDFSVTSYQAVPQDSTSLPNHVTASLMIPLSHDDIKQNLIVEVHDREASTVVSYTLELPELRRIFKTCTGIHVLLPKKDTVVGGSTLHTMYHASTIPLEIDFIFPHPGEYEIVKRAGGIDKSEQRWTFTVVDSND